MADFLTYNKLKPEKLHRQKAKEKDALFLNVKSKYLFLWDYFSVKIIFALPLEMAAGNTWKMAVKQRFARMGN